MEKLLKLQEVSDVNDVKKIRALYDNIESNVRSLEAMDITSEQYGVVFSSSYHVKITK